MTGTVVRYEPRGAAAQLFSCRAAEVVMSGPAGTGKSLACLFRLHLACLARPRVRCLIVRKTGKSLAATTLTSFNEKVAGDGIRAGLVRWYGGSQSEPAAYRYANGSRIVVGGMDNPDKVLSSEYDLIFADEATELTITDWETLGTRLRHGVLPWQQQIAACNPSVPKHWIKRRADEGGMTMLHSRHVDNPAYVRPDGSFTEVGAAYFAKLQALTGVRRARLYEGKWQAAEGVIFDGFDETVHVVDRFDIPREWPRYWSVDFGYTNPFVLQCWAEDGDGRLYLYREIYRTRTLVEDHAKRILRAVTKGGAWIEPRPVRIICDHDAEDRATLERHLGLHTTAANKTVSEGLQATATRFRRAGDGRPRIFILKGSLLERDTALDDAAKPACTAEEIPGYIWDITDGKPPKETPVKADDHGCDAMRYVVMDRDRGLVPRVRFL